MLKIDGIGAVASIQPDYYQSPVFTGQSSVEETSKTATSVNDDGFMVDTDKTQKAITKDQVRQAVDKMNKTMETYSTELRFQLHEKSGEYMVKIINTKDNSVIREIPPEKVLNMVAYFKEMLGLVIDKFA